MLADALTNLPHEPRPSVQSSIEHSAAVSQIFVRKKNQYFPGNAALSSDLLKVTERGTAAVPRSLAS